MNPLETNILLASKSPRRSQLLREAGFKFRIETKEVDEVFPSDMDVKAVAAYLAELKANACLDLLKPSEILLTADSTVVLENRLFNKPVDESDAFRMLSALSDKSHFVYTGICLANSAKKVINTGVSEVLFHPLSKNEIEYYIENYKPFDKAGAYGVQEWIGHCKIKQIKGTYNNIMGLPVALVYQELLNW